MIRRILPLLTGVCIARAAAAQLPVAEDAFRRGDYRAARAAYESVLRQDSANVRALYRLAILDSWDGKLQRSLDRFAKLRRLEPADPDIMVAHARVLAWAGKNGVSELLYDSVLARAPQRTDALAGRARAVAWAGDLDRAERLWRQAQEAHPDDAEILIGLAQTLLWKGKPELAESYAARARQFAPQDPTVRDVFSLVRAALRPELASSGNYAHDSDENAFVAHDASFTTSLGADLRATLHAGWRRATAPFAPTGLSYGGGGYAIAPLGHGAVLRAGLGARRLEPEGGTTRTLLTAQAGIGIRPARFASVSVGYSRAPFDETAALIANGYVVDGVDLSFDVAPRAGISVSGGGGAAWFSDSVENRRLSAVLAVMAAVGRGVETGLFGRMMGYRVPNPGAGYFAPDRFSLLEARAVFTWRAGRWGARADAGLGIQQVGSGAPTQSEWHAGLAATRGWGANSELALVGSFTNSAGSRTGTATAAGFEYWTVGLRLRQGL
ncbi:MAG: tetratricopeptide repeat protein [Gemmatimonadales bacterium]